MGEAGLLGWNRALVRLLTTAAVVISVAAMESWLATPARADLVRILHPDNEGAQARVDLIQQAKCEINTSYYIVGDDSIPLVFLSLLRDAARRGVTVRLLVDGHNGNNLIPRAMVAHLLREGVQIKEFHPQGTHNLQWLKHRMHDKLLIVDGQRLITGGRNMKNEYFGLDCRNYVDRDVYIRGCTAAEARCYFMSRWDSCDVCPARIDGKIDKETLKGQKHCELNDGCDEASICQAALLLDGARGAMEQCGFVRFDPGYDWSNGAHDVSCIRFLHDTPCVDKRDAGIGPDMMALLATAKCSVTLETPYMALSKEMRQLLKSLRCRGVRVTIVTNSFETNDHGSAQALYENSKRRYLRWGIDLWELRGCDHMHAKAAVIDGCVAVIGSYNFDELSQKKNSEVAVAIYDPLVAAELQASIDVHRQRAYEIGRNTHPIGYSTRYPGATRKQIKKLQRERIVTPIIKEFL